MNEVIKRIKPNRSRLWDYCILIILMLVFNYTVPHSFDNVDIQYSNKIFDKNGILIGYTFADNFYYNSEKDKSFAINNYSEVPPILIKALTSLEDKSLSDKFQNRLGLRFRGLARSIITLSTKGGGSGVFQQLVKNLFLNKEGGLNRKITESQIASAMYLNYKWEDMIVMYLNNVPFGNNIRGFKAASGFFYSKGLKECTIPEIAMLVGLLNAPNSYYDKADKEKNLIKNKNAIERRNLVLKEMVKDNVISKQEYADFSKAPIRFKFDTDLSKNATLKTLQFDDYVKNEFKTILKENGMDSNTTNLNIYTYFDIKQQEAAEKIIRNYWRNQFTGVMKNAQIALITIDPKTGGIITMVGGNPAAPWTGSNRALTLYKPVGSAFKPFFYGAMFERGFTINDTLPDKEITANWQWIAKNSNGEVSGKYLTLLQCITNSMNVPVCYAMNNDLVTPEEIKSLAKRCGIKQDLPNNKQIAIGGLTAGVSPLQMANAYATICNQGINIPPHAISKIEIPGKGKTKAKVIYKYDPSKYQTIAMNENIASQLKQCLESVVNNGTAASVKTYYKGYAAGKTGTSDENKDAWFVGFTNDFSTAVWIGFDDNKSSLPKEYNQGGKIAAPIWGLYMNEVYKKRK